MKNQISYLVAIVLFSPLVALAHPGRTDSSGCHTCRTKCASWGLSTGEYHCHQSKGAPQPVAPIHSIRNTEGVGSTVPAPEYASPKAAPIVNEVKKETPVVKIKTEEKNVIKDTPIVKKELKAKTPVDKKTIKNKPEAKRTKVTPSALGDKTIATDTASSSIPSPVVVKKEAWYKRVFSW